MKKTEDHIDSWVMNSKIKDRKYFILSKAEVKKYVKKKDRKMNKGNGWWLRCSSKYDKKRGDFCAQVVYNHGGFFKFDVTAEGLFVAVRPAAWIALTKEAR